MTPIERQILENQTVILCILNKDNSSIDYREVCSENIIKTNDLLNIKESKEENCCEMPKEIKA